MKYAAEMGSAATTYVSNFTKTGSGIQKSVEGREYRDTHRMEIAQEVG
jgi:hypothetical protein